MVQILGDLAPPQPRKFDQTAFEELSSLADTVCTAFEQNAVDRALDRLIEQPDRKRSGQLLARRLFRDAQKFLRVNRKREFITDEFESQSYQHEEPTPIDLFEVREAVATIRTGLLNLAGQDRRVFLARIVNAPASLLGVGDRQFRTLLVEARQRFWQQNRMDDARSIVINALSRWRWETIALLGPLTDCLNTAN